MIDLKKKMIGKKLIEFGNKGKERKFRYKVEIGKRKWGKRWKIDIKGLKRIRRGRKIRKKKVD